MVLVALVAACGGPRTASLADLTWEMEDYHGDEVRTSGVVIGFDESDGALEEHYVIQDADANRVKLLPAEVAQPFAGRTVTVSGAFEYDPERGRLLHIETIEPAG